MGLGLKPVTKPSPTLHCGRNVERGCLTIRKIVFIIPKQIFPSCLIVFIICAEKVCYKVCNMYYKVCNMCQQVCNMRYKVCNKNFLQERKKLVRENKKYLPESRNYMRGKLGDQVSERQIIRPYFPPASSNFSIKVCPFCYNSVDLQ